MSKVSLEGVKNPNDYMELVRMFLSEEDSKFSNEALSIGLIGSIDEEILKPVEKKDEIKKEIYKTLQKITGKTLKWGTLTGVKPLKLYNKLLDSNNNDESVVREILEKKYLVNNKKIDLLKDIHDVQKAILNKPKKNSVSVYIGIPFCPTRCTYCSFTSNQQDYTEILRYLKALYKEISYVSKEMKRLGLVAETVYIGGGTPTTLETKELTELVGTVLNSIPTQADFEFTVEAGRPDTITNEKLANLYKMGVNRISINPQSMNEKTLKLIGRDHSISDVRKAFEVAKNIGFTAINTDLIAGLPNEKGMDFSNTLNEVMEYEPENITIHTLALKKSSKLVDKLLENEKPIVLENDGTAEDMVDYATEAMIENEYNPYYIYRQKYMADNLENVGYAKKGTECIYNIRIMEEKQTVVAMGAGGSTKVYFPEEDRLERVMNISNYQLYIERIDEMLARKQDKLFSI